MFRMNIPKTCTSTLLQCTRIFTIVILLVGMGKPATSSDNCSSVFEVHTDRQMRCPPRTNESELLNLDCVFSSETGEYLIFQDVVRPMAKNKSDDGEDYSVCLATFATAHSFKFNIDNIANNFRGSISLAVYTDWVFFVRLLDRIMCLHRCDRRIGDTTSFSVIVPHGKNEDMCKYKEWIKYAHASTPDNKVCACNPDKWRIPNHFNTFNGTEFGRIDYDYPGFPFDQMRCVAEKSCHAKYTLFSSSIKNLPMFDMAARVSKALKEMNATALTQSGFWIIEAFKLNSLWNHRCPANVSELEPYVTDAMARPYGILTANSTREYGSFKEKYFAPEGTSLEQNTAFFRRHVKPSFLFKKDSSQSLFGKCATSVTALNLHLQYLDMEFECMGALPDVFQCYDYKFKYNGTFEL